VATRPSSSKLHLKRLLYFPQPTPVGMFVMCGRDRSLHPPEHISYGRTALPTMLPPDQWQVGLPLWNMQEYALWSTARHRKGLPYVLPMVCQNFLIHWNLRASRGAAVIVVPFLFGCGKLLPVPLYLGLYLFMTAQRTTQRTIDIL
jgi:hypothetical protein